MAELPAKLPNAKDIASTLAKILGIFGALPIELVRCSIMLEH